MTDSYIVFTLKMESESKHTIIDLKMMMKSEPKNDLKKSFEILPCRRLLSFTSWFTFRVKNQGWKIRVEKSGLKNQDWKVENQSWKTRVERMKIRVENQCRKPESKTRVENRSRKPGSKTRVETRVENQGKNQGQKRVEKAALKGTLLLKD